MASNKKPAPRKIARSRYTEATVRLSTLQRSKPTASLAKAQAVPTSTDIPSNLFDYSTDDVPKPNGSSPAPHKITKTEQVRNSTIYKLGKAWIDAGFNIIPISRTSKKPLVNWSLYYLSTSPRVTEQDLVYWSLGIFGTGTNRFSIPSEDNPNFAVVLSSGDFGLVVIDVDSPDDFSFVETTFGKTPLVVSTGRGRHYYYRGLVKSLNGQTGPATFTHTKSPTNQPIEKVTCHIDIKSNVAYVVGPGSTHGSGKLYQPSTSISTALLSSLPVLDERALRREQKRFQHDRDMARKASGLYAKQNTNENSRGEALAAISFLSGKTYDAKVLTTNNLIVLEACPLFNWAKSNPTGLNYDLRRVLASNTAKLAGEAGLEYYLELVRAYPRFNQVDEERLFKRLENSPYLLTYAEAIRNGWPGPAPAFASSPAALCDSILPMRLSEDDLEFINNMYFLRCLNKYYDYRTGSFLERTALEQTYPYIALEWLKKVGPLKPIKLFAESPTFDTRPNAGRLVESRGQGIQINTYKPEARIQKTKSGTSPCPAELYELIKNLADDDDDATNYIMDWISFRLQMPYKPQPALVLCGKKGSGKSTLLLLMRELTMPYFTIVKDVSLESGTFNEYMYQSILVSADEVTISNFKEMRRIADQLKSKLLAGNMVPINRKNLREFQSYNSTGWIFTSNASVPAVVEEDDRRYSIIRSRSALLDKFSFEWLKDLYKKLENADWIQSAANFFLNRDISKFNNIEPFKNDALVEAVESSRGDLEKWLHRLSHGQLPLPRGAYPISYLWHVYLRDSMKWDPDGRSTTKMPFVLFSRIIEKERRRRQSVEKSWLRQDNIYSAIGLSLFHYEDFSSDSNPRVNVFIIPDTGQEIIEIPTPEELDRRPRNEHY